MPRFIAAFALFLLGLSCLSQSSGLPYFKSAHAQSLPLLGAGPAASSAAPSYTGPGDIVSGATAFYALRAYTAAIAAAGMQQLANVRRASDSETCDFLVATSGGVGLSANCSGADNGVSLAAFLTSTTGAVTKLYDQTGNGNHVIQATAAQQPTLTFSCLGSLPCLTFVYTSSQSLSDTSWTTALNQPYSGTDVLLASGSNIAAFPGATTYPGGSIYFQHYNLANQYDLRCPTTALGSTGVTDNAVHAFSWVCSGASSVINADNSIIDNVSAGTTAIAAGTSFLGLTNSHFWDGKWFEDGLWPIGFSTTQQTSLCHNEFGYWGTSVSC